MTWLDTDGARDCRYWIASDWDAGPPPSRTGSHLPASIRRSALASVLCQEASPGRCSAAFATSTFPCCCKKPSNTSGHEPVDRRAIFKHSVFADKDWALCKICTRRDGMREPVIGYQGLATSYIQTIVQVPPTKVAWTLYTSGLDESSYLEEFAMKLEVPKHIQPM